MWYFGYRRMRFPRTANFRTALLHKLVAFIRTTLYDQWGPFQTDERAGCCRPLELERDRLAAPYPSSSLWEILRDWELVHGFVSNSFHTP